MSVPMSYSVWLKPAPDSALGRSLAKMVARHAAELGTPAFAPHVTLLGGFTAEDDVRATPCVAQLHTLRAEACVHRPQDAALRATRALADRVRALSPLPRCRAKSVQAGRLYYQCVYVLCEDDQALTAAHQLARDVFSSAGSAGPTFMPHASVVYGDLDEAEKAARAASVADELAPLLASGEASFTPTALALWRTRAGHTTEWTEVAEVPL